MGRIIKCFVFAIAFSSFVACAQAPVQEDVQSKKSCSISHSEREALLKLNYQEFDQSLPSGGWRKYDQCPMVARELIDAYTKEHADTLEKQQWDVLVWHSGQMSAMMGDYADAITKMDQTLKPNEKPTDGFLWNPYAKASIAFMKKDKPSLIIEREKLARGTSPYNRINLRKVDGFMRCFDSTYMEAYSGQCQPMENNIQRIQSLASPFDWKKTLPKDFFGIRDFLAMKKVILVGEVHGTDTIPRVFGNLVASIADQKSKTLVILEINQSSQGSIDDFLKTGNETILKKDPFFARDYQDGRSSKAMVKLLKRLARLPNIKVLCMDPVDGVNTMTGQERDTAMASFINTHRSGYDHTLVLSGNVHSSISIGTPWDKNFRPMGYEFKKVAKDLSEGDLLNIRLRHEKVDSWNCFGDDASSCHATYGKKVSTDYSEAVNYQSYFVWEGELVDGHNASIFIREAKISLPYLR